jgi:phospholipid transport system substrate-binding protein
MSAYTRVGAALAAAAMLVGAPSLVAQPVGAESAVPPTASAPRVVVEQTVAAVIDVLKQKKLPTEQKKQKIQDIAYARFDFPTMSRLVLARSWKTFKAPQQERFQAEFKTFLAKQYGTRLLSYEQEQVELLGERGEPRGDVTVRTRIVGGNFAGADVDYRMRKGKDGEWRAIDVVIEGISLVSNYRDQFQGIVAKKGAEGLLAELAKKNAAPDAKS